MRKFIFIPFLVLCLLLIVGCTDNNKYVDTKSIITNKDVLTSNQYTFYVSYEIEGMDGLFEATIKVKNKTEYDKYNIGDEYIFKRPATK